MKFDFNNLDINALAKDIDFESGMLKKVNNNLNLTSRQINILEKFNIDYLNASSLSELIYLVNLAFQESDDLSLDSLLEELSERNYYENTKK